MRILGDKLKHEIVCYILRRKEDSMANPKIYKVNAEIARTETKLAESAAKTAELTAKLKELRQHKINLENEEIIALFRREKFSEDEFAALLRSQREPPNDISHTADISASNPHGEDPEQKAEMRGEYTDHEE